MCFASVDAPSEGPTEMGSSILTHAPSPISELPNLEMGEGEERPLFSFFYQIDLSLISGEHFLHCPLSSPPLCETMALPLLALLNAGMPVSTKGFFYPTSKESPKKLN